MFYLNGFLPKIIKKYKITALEKDVLYWFNQFQNSSKMESVTQNNQRYYWLTLNKLISEFSCYEALDNEKKARRVLNSLVKKEVFEKTRIKNNLYFKFCNNVLDELLGVEKNEENNTELNENIPKNTTQEKTSLLAEKEIDYRFLEIHNAYCQIKPDTVQNQSSKGFQSYYRKYQTFTKEDKNKFYNQVKAYISICEKEQRENKYIKLFTTFLNSWQSEDYVSSLNSMKNESNELLLSINKKSKTSEEFLANPSDFYGAFERVKNVVTEREIGVYDDKEAHERKKIQTERFQRLKVAINFNKEYLKACEYYFYNIRDIRKSSEQDFQVIKLLDNIITQYIRTYYSKQETISRLKQEIANELTTILKRDIRIIDLVYATMEIKNDPEIKFFNHKILLDFLQKKSNKLPSNFCNLNYKDMVSQNQEKQIN